MSGVAFMRGSTVIYYIRIPALKLKSIDLGGYIGVVPEVKLEFYLGDTITIGERHWGGGGWKQFKKKRFKTDSYNKYLLYQVIASTEICTFSF